MELCEICRSITQRRWRVVPGRYDDEGDWIEHQNSFSDLCKSVSEGCKLCILLRQGLLDNLRESPGEWEADHVEAWLFDRDVEPAFKFWIVQNLTYPGDENGIMCDEALMNGFYYRRCFLPMDDTTVEVVGRSDESELDDMLDLGAFFQFTVPSDESPKVSLGRSRGLCPSISDARDWLHQCIIDHPECRQHNRDLPTRLLHIQSSEAMDHVLLVDTHNVVDQYAALSHCWGEKYQLQTTSDNYQKHKEGLRLDELPPTFRDAVFVAKSLDIQYLWIDSLCIIQNSDEDWERECSRMASVYGSALVTIAALDAADSSEGFFHHYRSPQFDSCKIPWRKNGENSTIMASITYMPGHMVSVSTEPRSHLSTRGWVLQERLLSQRVLSFSNHRLSWECSTFCRRDDMHYPYTSSRLTHQAVEKRSIRSLVDIPLAYEYWCDIVSTYSKCQLTKAVDKLPALSGLAQAISEVTGDSYVAGLWKNDMHVGLTWYQSYIEKTLLGDYVGHRPLRYRAPSWSWACSDSPIVFRSEIRSHTKDLVISPFKVDVKGGDPFGEVTHGILSVKGKIRIGGVTLDTSGVYLHVQSDLYDYEDTSTMIASVCFDSEQLLRRMKAGELQKEVTSLLVSYSIGGFPKWVALALEEIEGISERRVYRRIGIIICHERYEAGYRWFDDCKPQSMEIM